MATAKSFGIRELKLNPGKILRMVRESNESVELTIRGEVVARLVPVRQEPDIEEIEAFWRRHDEIGHEISKKWPNGVSAQDAVNDVRRDL